jgi:AraC-like DNA-binding protein
MSSTVRASSLRGYEQLMRQLGSDPGPLFRRYGIRASSLQDEDALIPLQSLAALLEASASATRCEDFGLRLALGQDISVLGPVAIAMQNAPTVGDAVNYASRYLYVQSPGLILNVRQASPIDRDGVELRVEVRLPRAAAYRQTLDLSVADLHHMLKLLAGNAYKLRAVTLPHAALASNRTYRRFFEAPVLPEQEHAALHVSRSTLAAKLGSVNATLRKIAVDYLAMTYDEPLATFSSRVQQALRHALGTRADSRPNIASLLNVHPRTLQRRLTDEGTTFDLLRDQMRRDLAIRYLEDTHIPLPQLAGMLGLSEHSALTRSCRRWFGRSPSQLRAAAVESRAAIPKASKILRP